MTEAHPGNVLFAVPWPVAMIAACGDCLQTCTSAGASWQSEIARFADRRIAENRRTWTTLLSSRDLETVQKIQQQWGLQAANDYAEEATRIARLFTSVGLTGTTPEVQDAATLLG